jgi:hypothetical protein
MQQELLEIQSEIDAALKIKKKKDEENLQKKEEEYAKLALNIVKRIPEKIIKAIEMNNSYIIVHETDNYNETLTQTSKYVWNLCKELSLNVRKSKPGDNDPYHIVCDL